MKNEPMNKFLRVSNRKMSHSLIQDEHHLMNSAHYPDILHQQSNGKKLKICNSYFICYKSSIFMNNRQLQSIMFFYFIDFFHNH